MQPQEQNPQQEQVPVVQDVPFESEVSAAESQDGPTELPEIQPIQWQSIEYIQHDKSPLWYVGFVIITLVLMAVAVILVQSWTFAILVPIMAVALMVYAHRPARQLSYVLSEKGLYINDQLHPLGEFKGFGVIQEQPLHSLMLVPVKRFRPGLTVYFPDEVGEPLVDLLGGYLPMQELKFDLFDQIVRKLRI